jgi:hypothetical protein
MDNMIAYTPSRGVVVVVEILMVDKTQAICKVETSAKLMFDNMPDCFFIGTNIS